MGKFFLSLLWIQTSDKTKESKVQVNTCSNTVKKNLKKITNSISLPFQYIAIPSLLYSGTLLDRIHILKNANHTCIYNTFTTVINSTSIYSNHNGFNPIELHCNYYHLAYNQFEDVL